MTILVLSACKPMETTPPVSSRPAEFATRFPVKLGNQSIRVQVALTDLETARGLMGRRSLEADEGMLFVFAHNGPRGFWMRNVPINLALGYFTADGRLDEIKELYAENPETVPSRSQNIRYVLEMREGWFAVNDVREGAVLDLAAVRDAIRRRGFKPENFLLPEK